MVRIPQARSNHCPISPLRHHLDLAALDIMKGQMDASVMVPVLLTTLVLICSRAAVVEGVQPWEVTDWGNAHATFYGGNDASGTMGGACGYGNLYALGYGTATTALSYAMFNNGLTCGACFNLQCQLDGTQWCYAGGKSITVTVTNSCPPGSTGGWCDPPKLHFDLSYPMFAQLAQPVGGVIPVRYKRVPCSRQGGVRFTLYGNAWFNYILVHNVAGGGDVASLQMKGDKSGWSTLSHNWGQFWSGSDYVVGQALSFIVTLGNGATKEFPNVAPENWYFQQTFEANQNF